MFRLSIVTPQEVFYDADIRSLVAPGKDGYLGVLSNHAPLITALRPGKIEFRDADDELHVLAVTDGFLEVSNNRATVLAQAVEDASEIDLERAKSAYDRHKARLKEAAAGDAEVDRDAERAAIERATNRIRLYNETH
jgi:F-type H+-transporting ATPase subunit epsilon